VANILVRRKKRASSNVLLKETRAREREGKGREGEELKRVRRDADTK
jgi:hypothetical protein